MDDSADRFLELIHQLEDFTHSISASIPSSVETSCPSSHSLTSAGAAARSAVM